MKETAYTYEKCQKEITVPQGEKIPICCGLPMTSKLEVCTRPFNAESARLDTLTNRVTTGQTGAISRP